MTQLEEVIKLVEDTEEKTVQLATDIWNYAELSFCEVKSMSALCKALEEEGFVIETNIAGIPTAFTATYRCGNGGVKVGLLAEYDALDGLSQVAAQPRQEAVVEGGAGHGCGHNLLGAGCFSAAVALKNYLVNNKKDGTVAFFGCPAEEGAGSKQFIARAGYFDDIDFAYTWHPGTLNGISPRGYVAIMGAKFTFDGIASHAGGAPHLGRSALDAVELMNVGVNYLREHMIDQARIHYAYADAGGTAPNVVPSHAVIKYEVRAPHVSELRDLFDRVVNVAKGAALMTDTTMKYEITMAFSDYLPNQAMAQEMDQCLKEIGAPEWTEEDYALASAFLHSYPEGTFQNIKEELQKNMPEENLDKLLRKPLDSNVHPFDVRETGYDSLSTDVGDVGYATPTVMLGMATACLGNVGHSWQNTAFSCSKIGMKGMMAAAKVMTLACIRTMEKPELIAAARDELRKKNGGKYTCPLPDYCMPPIGTY